MRVLVAALAALTLLAGCSRGTELDPPDPTSSTRAGAASGDGDVRELVARLEQALRGRDAAALESLGTPAVQPLLAAVVRNVEQLDVTDVTARYLLADAPLSSAEQDTLGEGASAARIELEYSYAGIDQRPARLESRMLVVPGADGPRLAGFGGVSTGTPGADADGPEDGVGTRTPLWLSTPLTVVRRDRTVLAVAGSDPGRLPGLVRTAYAQVREVLPQWDGPLVVEVPASTEQLDAVLAAPEGRYDAIAGVAATADGSTERGAPTRVYLNPSVFDPLSRQGAQVVLTHEATHVAVGAPYADMPLWLLEGFADYVALAGDRVPVDVAARQVLQRVRDQGLPDGLPQAADLAPTAPGLGATYEEAWLACRYLGQRFGQAAMVRFYERVDAGTPQARAFRQLGTTEQDFVAGWRQDLAGLAGVAG